MNLLAILLAAAVLAPPEDLGTREPVLETKWFTFHSHLGFNLYDAVLTSSTARKEKKPDPMHDGPCFAGLVQEERSAWDAAVGYYADTVAKTSDFSRERAVIRAHFVGVDVGLDDDDRRDLALALLFLRAAAPAYRACRWTEQDAANRRWIAELAPRLAKHADEIGPRLEKLFGIAWRKRPILVDTVATGGWSGADTTDFRQRQTHTQITTLNPGYQGKAALEMIFHEASHELVWPRGRPIADAIAAAAKETGVPIHPSLWHGILFVTVGEVARDVYQRSGEGPYTPVAEGVFRGDWAVLQKPLAEHWIPYVRGEITREEAARRVMKALPPKGEKGS